MYEKHKGDIIKAPKTDQWGTLVMHLLCLLDETVKMLTQVTSLKITVNTYKNIITFKCVPLGVKYIL